MRSGHTTVTTLRRYIRAKAMPSASPECCELCSVALPPTHRHLLEIALHRLVCACDPCALLFENVVEGRFRTVPRDAVTLPDFRLSDIEWASLALPIHLAFFVRHTTPERLTAYYPSPAGATESLLPLSAWEVLVKNNPNLSTMQPDIEALLVNRVDTARDYLIVPIDACFELVGLVRMHWHGLSGGTVVWEKIERFFENLRACSRPQPKGGGRHA